MSIRSGRKYKTISDERHMIGKEGNFANQHYINKLSTTVGPKQCSNLTREKKVNISDPLYSWTLKLRSQWSSRLRQEGVWESPWRGETTRMALLLGSISKGVHSSPQAGETRDDSSQGTPSLMDKYHKQVQTNMATIKKHDG